MRFILASKSPRRKQLLSKVIDRFEVIEANVVENSDKPDPRDRVVELALLKARAVFSVTEGDRVVIGSDTLCYLDGVYLGKPDGVDGARKMLAFMSGKTHMVYTGVAVIVNGREHAFYDCSEVTFKTLTDEDIDEYIRVADPLDKAGAYGIQDGFVVQGYRGSFDNIVGLPTEKLKQKWGELGLPKG